MTRPLQARVHTEQNSTNKPLLKICKPTQRLDNDHLAHLLNLVKLGAAHRPEAQPISFETIENPQQIKMLIRALAGYQCEGVIRGRNEETCAVVATMSRGIVQLKVEESCFESPFVLELSSHNCLYRFYIEQASLEQNLVSLQKISRVERIRHRIERRVVAPSFLSIRFPHPMIRQLTVERPLTDFSSKGLSFRTDPLNDLVYPGLELGEIDVLKNGKLWIRGNGKVCHVSEQPFNGYTACGLSFRCLPEDQVNYDNAVDSHMYPHTKIGATWTEDLWSLFNQSGYFKLSGKSKPNFMELKKSFAQVSRVFDTNPNLGCHSVYESEMDNCGVEANLSMLKVYQGTWIGHQLSKYQNSINRNNSGREIIRQIYLRGFEHALRDSEVKWVMAYAESNVPWHQRTHFSFAKEYEASNQACTLPFRLMEGSVSALIPSPLPTGLSIGLATDSEVKELLNVIAHTRPIPYVEALDLVPQRFELSRLQSAFEQVNLERSREVFVARMNGVPMAAAIMETGSLGTNLFRLLDGVRLFPLVSGVESVFEYLLQAAARWYEAKGKESFIYYLESDDMGHAQRAGLEDLGEGDLWILSAKKIPDFLEYVCMQTAP